MTTTNSTITYTNHADFSKILILKFDSINPFYNNFPTFQFILLFSFYIT